MKSRTIVRLPVTRRIWACLLVALLALAGTCLLPTVAHASTTTTLVVQVRQDNASATSMLKQINTQRKKNGLVKLKLDNGDWVGTTGKKEYKDGYTWYQVYVVGSEDLFGWIAGSLIGF